MKIKISKKNDDIINNLRKQLGKYEEELKIEKSKKKNNNEKYKKKIEILNNKIKKINSNYKSLEKRRDCEIEGFTNDILRLRKQLKALENHLVNTESPLDKEMELLNLGKILFYLLINIKNNLIFNYSLFLNIYLFICLLIYLFIFIF